MFRQALFRRLTLALVCTTAATLLATPNAFAQSTFATLSGTVTDASGAVLPGASVTLTAVATGVERTTVADGTGTFQLPNIDAGRYRLVVRLDGLAETAREVELLARQAVRADLELQGAGTAERIDVRAVRPVIETERSTVDSS